MNVDRHFSVNRDAIESLLNEFEDAVRAGQNPTIEDYLTRAKSDQESVLTELIHIDLEYRIKDGEEVKIETYLDRFPIIADDRQVVLDLIAAEYSLRQRSTRGANLDEFLERFPEYRSDLPVELMRQRRQRPRKFSVRLNCPHCQNPIEILAGDLEHIVCPACGSTVPIAHDRTLSWKSEKLPQLGRFQLEEKVGQGAFATVYRAKDKELERTVAVKLPRSWQFSDQDDEERFFREARSVAQLQHPGIVAIYDVGTSGTFPYLVCEFADGITLADAITGKQFGFRESAQLVVQLSEALAYAHKQGVVHRDVKPSNIMIAADGMPRLMDFGLAKRDGGDLTMTIEGHPLGTPAYMPPEQAAGEAHYVDGRSDIYSLGVILYQLLTGELPFRGNRRMLMHQVLHDEPRAPRTLNDRIPRDLETICLKAMAKDKGRRYPTSEELAADLNRYLSGEPILARPVGRIERAWRWSKRNAAVASLTAIAVGLLVLVAVVGVVGYVQTSVALDREEVALQNTLEEKSRADENAAHAAKSAILAIRKAEEAEHQSQLAQANATLAQEQRDRAKTEALRANRLSSSMIELFRSSDPIGLSGTGYRRPEEMGETLTARDLLSRAEDQVLAELSDEPIVQGDLCRVIGDTYFGLGLYKKAEELTKRAAELHKGVDDLRYAKDMTSLARALHWQGDIEEPESLLRRALTIYESVATNSGEWDDQTKLDLAETKFDLAWLLYDQGKGDGESLSAESLFKDVISVRSQILGEDARQTILATSALIAHLIGQKGREVEALMEAVKGHADPAIAEGLLTLWEGFEYRKDGEYEKAADCYRTVIDLVKQQFPPAHPAMIAIKIDWAGLLKEKGNHAQAEVEIREALKLAGASLPGHPRLARPLTDFARELVNRGSYDEAEWYYREALAILSRRGAPRTEARRHGKYLIELGRLCAVKGDYGGAIEALEEALSLGKDKIDTGQAEHQKITTNELASVLLKAGRFSDAEQRFKILLDIVTNHFAQLEVHSCLERIINCCRETGNYTDALTYAAQAAQLLPDKSAPDLVRAEQDARKKGLGLLRHEWLCRNRRVVVEADGESLTFIDEHGKRSSGKIVDDSHVMAIDWGNLLGTVKYDRIVWSDRTTWKKQGEGAHLRTDAVRFLHGLGNFLYYEKGDLDEAEGIYRQALETSSDLVGVGHPLTSDSMVQLAKVLQKRGKYDEAESLLSQAIELRRQGFGPNHLSVAVMGLQLARLRLVKGDASGASKQALDSLNVCRLVFGDYLWTHTIRDDVAKILRDAGQADTAEELLHRQYLERRKALPPVCPRVFVALEHYVEHLLLADKPQEANACLQDAMQDIAPNLPERSWRRAWLNVLTGEALISLDRLDEAERLLLDAHNILVMAFGAQHERVRRAVQALVRLYDHQSNPEEAAKFRSMLQEVRGHDDDSASG